MQQIIIDACSIINLYNAEALASVVQLRNTTFTFSPLVCGELSEEVNLYVSSIVQSGKAETFDDSKVPAEIFVKAYGSFRLGKGETECIAIAANCDSFTVCSDDKSARKAAQSLLGTKRVTGSLGLLLRCVSEAILSDDCAYDCYLQMKQKGAFLPVLGRADFTL